MRAARNDAAFLLRLCRWSVAFGSSLVGWLCVTSPAAPPVLSPLWPSLLILLGSFAAASAVIGVLEAAVEATLQCYCEEVALLSAAAPTKAPAGGYGTMP